MPTFGIPHDFRRLVGTPAEVAARLDDLAGELRFDHVAHWARLPGLSHEPAMTSLRLFAAEVLPTRPPSRAVHPVAARSRSNEVYPWFPYD